MKKETRYHHGNLRASLLEEARRVIEESGDGALSLRACARTLGVDIAAAYRHFRNKDEVLAAVVADGFVDLGQEMQAAMEATGRSVEGAEAYFLSCCRGYIHFGLAHKHLYRLMFGGRCDEDSISAQGHKNAREAGADPYELLASALDLLVEASLIPASSREGSDFLVWASVHGLVSLLIEGRGYIDEKDYEAVIARSCGTLMRGL